MHAARASLFSPCLLVVDTRAWATAPLGVAVRNVICGFHLFIFPPGYVSLWNSKTPHRPTGERVSWCLETFPLLRLPPWDGSPSLTLLSLFLSFIFCPTAFRRQWAAFLGASTNIQKLFCGICLAFKWSLNEFVWENVVSPSYSSAIFLYCSF